MKFSRMQEISRMSLAEYKAKPLVLKEFRDLLSTQCTFVSNWNTPLITPDVHRIYGKKKPAKVASDEYIQQVKNQLSPNEYIESFSKDVELTYNSHEEWQPACEGTKSSLDHHVKEPRVLLLFKGAKFIFTYNCDGYFSQSQVGVLYDMPSVHDVRLFRKISVLIAPPGIKHSNFDINKEKMFYLNLGWKEGYVGIAPERTYSVQSNLKAQRKQYGLKPHVTSTVHSSMGDTLPQIATEISFEDKDYALWDKAQIIVLLSRTRFAKDIIFVGNKRNTLNAICHLIQTNSQWEEYMQCVLSLVCINKNNTELEHFDYSSYPFQIKDVPLPVCNTGFVYMIISTKDHTKNYIGQTFTLGKRLYEHNSGYGAEFTSDIQYRPWFLFMYVCGFNKDRKFMLSFERKWQRKRNKKVSMGQKNPRKFASLAQEVINEMESFGSQNLRIVTLFK